MDYRIVTQFFEDFPDAKQKFNEYEKNHKSNRIDVLNGIFEYVKEHLPAIIEAKFSDTFTICDLDYCYGVYIRPSHYTYNYVKECLDSEPGICIIGFNYDCGIENLELDIQTGLEARWTLDHGYWIGYRVTKLVSSNDLLKNTKEMVLESFVNALELQYHLLNGTVIAETIALDKKLKTLEV